MSSERFFISDLHFFHANLLQGGKIGIRPFATLNEMHERIIDGWNSVVKPQDKVYMLGDLTLDRPQKDAMKTFKTWERVALLVMRLRGQKRLLLGNHDYWSVAEYMDMGFEQVCAMKTLDKYIITHVPVHPNQFGRFVGNVHGHLHERVVMEGLSYTIDRGDDLDPEIGTDYKPDPRYLNVCAEQLNYVPINFDEVKRRIQ